MRNRKYRNKPTNQIIETPRAISQQEGNKISNLPTFIRLPLGGGEFTGESQKKID
jgi:hypothetical protein